MPSFNLNVIFFLCNYSGRLVLLSRAKEKSLKEIKRNQPFLNRTEKSCDKKKQNKTLTNGHER